MQVIANIDQADIGLVEQAKSVKFTVDAFPGKEFEGKIQQMRLNPQNVQNVVTYNVVIDVNNPEQKLKPGMTTNLTITIDERNNVLKVPNSALRFIPQDGTQGNSQRRSGNGNNQARSQGAATPNGAGANSDGQGGNQSGAGGNRNFAGPTAPVLSGQTRIVWVLDQNKELNRRRIVVGLTDGISTEVLDGDLKEGEMVVTGQTVGSAAKSQAPQTQSPFGGAQRGVGGGGGGRRP
jgi:HlyD family secretion protein